MPIVDPYKTPSGSRAPTAVAGRRLDMANTGESIESANVSQARGRTAQAVDTAVIPSDIAKRRADSQKSELDALEAKMRAGIPGGLATQDERQTATVFLRMTDAKMRRDMAVAEDKDASNAPLLPELVERVPFGDIASNYMVSSARRRVVSNNLDMLDAALWLSTGAAYNKEQLRNLSKAYFPQPGDDAKGIADKNGKLNALLKSARTRASMGLATAGGQAAFADATGGKRENPPAAGASARPLPLAVGETRQSVLKDARAAIAAGKDPRGVADVLRSMGIDPKGL